MVSDWQPIETAPKDGKILVAGPDWCAVSSDRRDGVVWTVHPPLVGTRPYRNDGAELPTHWMPLPDLPVVTP